jgi:hypothetical protein
MVCAISLRFQPPNTITTNLHSFKTITRFPFYSPSLSQQPKLIILFFLKKLVGTSILKIELKIMSGVRERAPMIRVRLLKKRRREVKVDPHLVANGRRRKRFPCLEVNGRRRRRFPCLKVNGMFQAWWPMEGEGKILFTSSHFLPNQCHLNL